MKALRRALFWAHLAAGCAAGLVIAVLCATGALLAFQPQILRAVENGSRRAGPSSTAPLGPGALLRSAAEASPGAAPTAVTISADPEEAAAVAFGRERVMFLDPRTGAVLGSGSEGWRRFFAKVQDVHRRLALEGEGRAAGEGVTGAANVLFFGLALSGLYIWWPRLRGVRRVSSVALPQRRASGKARDFNWHNVVGVWTALPLLVLTATGIVLSYRWAGDLVYRLAGTAPPPPPSGGRPGTSRDGRGVRAKPSPLSAQQAAALDRLWPAAAARSEGWRAITLRLPEKDPGPAAFSIEETRFRNRAARSSLTLDPATGEVLKWEPYDANPGRQARSWMRFLHTGEALGPAAQLIAALACLGGVLLAWTGIALSLRRLSAWRARAGAPSTDDDRSLPGVQGAVQ